MSEWECDNPDKDLVDHSDCEYCEKAYLPKLILWILAFSVFVIVYLICEVFL